MKAIKFDLKAKQGMLKNPLTSRGVNLSFTNLHVVALKGLLGATLGFSGKLKVNNDQQTLMYSGEKKVFSIEDRIPDNILKLEGLNYSLLTHLSKDTFIKKVVDSTNTNGINFSYEKATKPNTILTKNELMENIYYTVYIYEDSPYYVELKEHLIKGLSHYHRYLGKNQFTVEIVNIEELELILYNQDSSFQLTSLYKKGLATFDEDANDYLGKLSYFGETLPCGTNYDTSLYNYDDYLLTNSYLSGYKGDVYKGVDGYLLAKLS